MARAKYRTVAGGDQHSVDFRARGRKLANILVSGAISAAILGVNHAFDRLLLALPGATNCDKSHIFFREHPIRHPGAASAPADASQENSFAGRHRAISAKSRGGNQSWGGPRGGGQQR